MILVNPICAIGEINRCIVTVWAGQPTVDDFANRNKSLVDLVKRHPGNAALIEIVETLAPPPPDKIRKGAMEVFPQLGTDLSAIGFVMEGNSWRVSIARAVIQSMSFMVAKLQPTRVFKQTVPMLAWIAEQLRNPQVADYTSTTLQAIEHLRKLLHAQPSPIGR